MTATQQLAASRQAIDLAARNVRDAMLLIDLTHAEWAVVFNRLALEMAEAVMKTEAENVP